MNIWTLADTNGLLLLKKSWSSIGGKPRECLYASLLIANTLTCFTLLFLLEYHVYGIHMLDISTLSSLFSWNVFDHFIHFVSLLGIVFFSIFSSLFIHAALSYTVINDLVDEKRTPSNGFLYTLNHLKKLFFLSFVFLNHYIITIFDIISISPFLTLVQHTVEGKKHTGPTATKSSDGALVVPALLLSKSNNISEALKESENLITSTFGAITDPTASFTKIKIILYTLAGAAILISAPFDAIDTLATSFFAGFLLLLSFKIIEVGLIIYQGSLYSYCKYKVKTAFSKEELAELL